MIQNRRQYLITQAQLRRLQQELLCPVPTDIHPDLAEAEQQAIRSQMDDLEQSLAAYEALARQSTFVFESVQQIGQVLVQARIALGLTQKDLADRLELKEQQIQRYESSHYASASLRRIQQVSEALGMALQGIAAVFREDADR